MKSLNKDSYKILIVGGGIGGMTTALALAKRGYRSLIIEQAPYFRESGAGIILCPNVFKVFSYLNISERMREICFYPDHLVWADGLNGQEYMRLPMGKQVEERFGYPYGSFHREELLRILVEECKKYPLIETKTSSRIHFAEDTGSQVIAHSEQGELFVGDALIDAEGLWSLIRDQILGKEKPRPSGHVTHRGIVDKANVPSHLYSKDVIHWDVPNGHVVQYPMGTKGLFNIVAVYHTNDIKNGESTEGDPKTLMKHYEQASDHIKELLKHVDTSKKWMMYDRPPIKEWTQGRITLLGDAAHPTLPHLTQGAGMAIEDAVVIAKHIDLCDGDFEKAFKDYQTERYLRTAHIQLFSWAYGESHHADGVARELRNYMISSRSVEENYDWISQFYNGIELEALHAQSR